TGTIRLSSPFCSKSSLKIPGLFAWPTGWASIMKTSALPVPRICSDPLIRNFVMAWSFQRPDQGGMIGLAPAFASHAGVHQLLHRCGIGQRDTERSRTFQCQAQILLMQSDAETWRKRARYHPLTVHLEHARGGEATHQRAPHFCRITARLAG